MELGVHLPLVPFGDEPLSLRRLEATADAARACGFAATLLAAGELAPAPHRPIPLWIGSWGSRAGLARVVRLADGWLASAYNTTPERFAKARKALPDGFPNALATMWTWVTDDPSEADRMLSEVLAPMLRRDPGELQVCVGSAEQCAELLARYAEAGCERVYLWPLGDEARQIQQISAAVPSSDGP